jgi:hypothetical protein
MFASEATAYSLCGTYHLKFKYQTIFLKNSRGKRSSFLPIGAVPGTFF